MDQEQGRATHGNSKSTAARRAPLRAFSSLIALAASVVSLALVAPGAGIRSALAADAMAECPALGVSSAKEMANATVATAWRKPRRTLLHETALFWPR